MSRRGARSVSLRPAAGFTLIEAMIVVALLAIILAIAIPNYRDYIVRSNRSAARQVLVEAAQYLERVHTFSGCYDRAKTDDCINRSGSATVLPSTLQRAPSEGRATYFVKLDPLTSSSFTLTATPCGNADCSSLSDADTTFQDPCCGTLTLTQTGLRGATCGNAATCRSPAGCGSVATCWQR